MASQALVPEGTSNSRACLSSKTNKLHSIARISTPPAHPAFYQQIFIKHILCSKPVQDTGGKKKKGQGLCPNGAKSRGRNSPVIAPVKYRGVGELGWGAGPDLGPMDRKLCLRISEVKSEEVVISWGLVGQVAMLAKGGPGQGKSKSKSLEVRMNLAHLQTGSSVLLEARWIQCRGTLGPSYLILRPGELGGRVGLWPCLRKWLGYKLHSGRKAADFVHHLRMGTGT